MQSQSGRGLMYLLSKTSENIPETGWINCISTGSITIQEALLRMESTKIKASIIVDEGMKLRGIVTDGDIRRALVRHLPLTTKIKDISNKKPTFSTIDKNEVHFLEILNKSKIFVLPILNDKDELVGVYDLSKENKLKRYKNPVFLMAGGFGTRLYPLTENCPKPLLQIGGKPLLESILEHFILCGFENFYISLHFLPEKIIEYFGDGSKWGCKINYIMEEIPLGTGGALGLLPRDVDLPVIVMNGDILTNIDFSSLLDFHNNSKSESTVCVRKYDFQVPYGVVEINKDLVADIVEKPWHQFFVNAGIYVLNPSIIKSVFENERIDMPVLLKNRIVSGNKVSTFPIHEYWLDIGQKHDFERAQVDFENVFNS